MGVSKCSWTSILFSLIKENWICAMIRSHAEPNINILLTRNLPFDYDIRQWSRRLMIPMHCLWAKSNNRARGRFECDVVGAVVVPVCLLFQVVQIKQVNCNMSTKMWIIINKSNWKISRDILDNCTHKSIKPRKSR